ncbi:MAG: hypothetical protein VZR31_09400 [Lachnospiraceae bacterium]|nr:hypothetical protein [Lachnospiraceae bacterium]
MTSACGIIQTVEEGGSNRHPKATRQMRKALKWQNSLEKEPSPGGH